MSALLELLATFRRRLVCAVVDCVPAIYLARLEGGELVAPCERCGRERRFPIRGRGYDPSTEND